MFLPIRTILLTSCCILITSSHPTEVRHTLSIFENDSSADNDYIDLVRSSVSSNDAEFACPKHCNCPSPKIVNCKKAHLEKVPTDIPKSVQELYLGHNNINTIKNEDFKGLVNLTVLGLNNNKISHLEDSIFDDLQNMSILYLGQNFITSLPQNCLKNNQKLTKLYINNNKLTQIPYLGDLPLLKQIGLNNNLLKSATFQSTTPLKSISSVMLNDNPGIVELLVDDFAPFAGPVLAKISVARCSISNIDNGTFSKLTRLISLDLSYNKVRGPKIRAVIDGLSGSSINSLKLDGSLDGTLDFDTFKGLADVPLQHLFFSHCNIDIIKNGSFSRIDTLQSIDASYSRISSIEEDTLRDLKKLNSLKLNNNRLSGPPIGLPSSLIYITLANNPSIQHISENSFLGLVQVNNISLSNCGITTIDKYAFVDNSALVKLDLSHNRISGTALSTELFDTLDNLQELSLKSNNMGKLESESNLFAKLRSLQWLDLSNNNCESLSLHLFDHLLELRTLFLNKNKLGSLIASDKDGHLFLKLSSLKYLDLSGNYLTSLPMVLFRGLKNVEILAMQDNSVSTWQYPLFEDLHQLALLNLSSNAISIIIQKQIDHMPNSKMNLSLTANPFNCWCDLRWFRDAINTTAMKVNLLQTEEFRCETPTRFSKVPLLSFNTNDIRNDCGWKYLVYGITGGVIILLSVTFITLVCNRWRLMYTYYKVKRFFKPVEGEDRPLLAPAQEYDAFFSVANDRDDHRFAEKLLRHVCNDADYECGGSHRVWYYDWHVAAGKSRHTEIAEHMRLSKRVSTGSMMIVKAISQV